MSPQFLTLALVTILICPTAPAQWVQTNGPYGGVVSSLLVKSAEVFAGVGTRVFLSADSGSNWTAEGPGLSGTIQALAISPSAAGPFGKNLFAGSYGAGVFLSTSGGASWKEVNTGLTNKQVNCLTVSGTNLFAGTRRGVYLLADSGSSWVEVSTGLPSVYTAVFALFMNGTNLFAGTDRGIFRSTNNGTSWTSASGGLPYNSYGFLPAVNAFAMNGTKLFSGTSRGVFVSANNESTWTPVNFGLTDSTIHAFAVSGENLYAGTSGGVFLSTDDGASWTAAGPGIEDKIVYSLAVNGAYLLAGTENGLFRSADGAKIWTAVPVTGTTVECFASDGSRLFTGVARNHVFLSTDRGTTWLSRGKLTADYNIYCLALAGPNLLAGGTCISGRVDISTDGGLTWRRALDTALQSPPFAGSNFNAEAFLVREPLVFVAGNGVWKSSDNGSSWSSRNDGFGASEYLMTLAMLDTNLFAGGYPLFISNVNGGPWRPAGAGMAGASVKCLTVCATTLFAGTWSDGVYRSTDYGATWTQANDGLEDSVIYALATSGTKVFAGTQHKGVFLTTDNGTRWTAVNEGLKDQTVMALEVFGPDLYGGTAGLGVWRRPLSELVVSVEGTVTVALPRQCRLFQNYPNPFNPSTTIRYGLPNRSHVTLTVFNTLGQQVAQLVNEEQDARYHDVTFDGKRLSSGIYFYKMQAGDFVQTRKLLLCK